VIIIKAKRQVLILRAVAQGDITTQEQLLDYLQANGVAATQATVSRDMKELRLRKSGIFYEVAPKEENQTKKYRQMLHNAIESVDGAGNIVCVRCSTGMAQVACVAIDAMPPAGLVGSLAGEDTIFLLCRDAQHMCDIQEELRQYVT
jgi:transcriptional regulator of arginine metabolism